MSSTTSATSDRHKVRVTKVAIIEKTKADGGAWMLNIVGLDEDESYAFTSYRHAQKFLSNYVGRDRIRMVRNDDRFTYEWASEWNG